MKKIYSFIALIAAVAMFTACGSDDASYKATPTLEIAAADVLFEAEGGDGSIILNTDNTVAATTDASWLTLSVDGNKVIVTANPNLSLEGRNAVIKLRAGNTEAEVTATQKSSIYGVPSLEYEIGDYQASLDIPVVHSQDVSVESNTDWLTAVWNEETNQIEIVAENNDEEDAREGTITLTMGDYSDEITITQSGLLLELEKDNVATGSDEAASVSVNVKHSRPISSVVTEDEWVTAKFNSKTNVLECDVEANETGWERLSTITVTSGPATRTLTISQFDYDNDVLGEFDLVFATDANGSSWEYYPVEITKDAMTLHYSSTRDYTIPVEHDAENRTMFVGPSLSLVGTYSTSYYIRLHFMFVYNGYIYNTYALNIQDNSYSDAEFYTYEYEDGSRSAMANFAGSILAEDDLIGISLWAYNDPEATEAGNRVGFLNRLYFPYLERVVYEPEEEEGGDESGAKAYKTIRRNTNAPLGSKQNPIPAFNKSLSIIK